jgi:hypothetical protein
VLLIETVLTLLALVIALVYPSLGRRQFEKVEAVFSRLAQRRALAVIAVGVTALALRAAVLPIEPIPEPIVHDEFGYLLSADTFAHGRLTNPTPPMWEHFETFHVMFHPTYASIYPPAQGLFLAFGKVFFGHPFWGVWLSIGLMCAAITWMLQGWLSPEWALLGGAIAIVRYGVFGYWADSYWGGTVAAIGGALVLGALPRIKKSQKVANALLMGIGLTILANSRPYEGFVFSLPIAMVLIYWVFSRDGPPLRITVRRLVIPLMLLLAITSVGTSYYFWRVTGSPIRMPYQIERQTYAVAPYFIWQHVRAEPEYRHPVMRKMFVDEEMLGRNVTSSTAGVLLRSYLVWSFFLGPVLSLPLLMLFFSLRRNLPIQSITPSLRMLLAVLASSIFGAFLVVFYSPHYSAPATGLIIAFVVLSMRQLRSWGSAGMFLVRAIVVVCFISFALRASGGPLNVGLHEFYEFAWHQKAQAGFGKAALQERLERTHGTHLVIVRYGPDHKPFDEWVYNEADIDHAKIIWAREMSAEQNENLIQYFKNRRAWLLEPDINPPRLAPYSSEPEHAGLEHHGNVSSRRRSP